MRETGIEREKQHEVAREEEKREKDRDGLKESKEMNGAMLASG